MSDTQELNPIQWMNKAVNALYLELPEPVANDVKKRWEAARDYMAAQSLVSEGAGRWVKVEDRNPAKSGSYNIKGLNNQGNSVENEGIWFTGTLWMVREGCTVIEWHESTASPAAQENQFAAIGSAIIVNLEKGNQHEPYLVVGRKSYSRANLIEEIKTFSPIGIETIMNVVGLSLDMLHKQSTPVQPLAQDGKDQRVVKISDLSSEQREQIKKDQFYEDNRPMDI